MATRPKPLPPALLKKALKTSLRDACRIAVLGIGSELRGDDAAGILVADKLQKLLTRSRSGRVKVFDGGTAPENLTGEIIRFLREGKGVGHVVLVDAADLKAKPGSICLLSPDDLAGVSFSTHQLPMSILVSYLQKSVGCNVTLMGIQPKDVKFGAKVSPEIRKAASSLASMLCSAIPSK